MKTLSKQINIHFCLDFGLADLEHQLSRVFEQDLEVKIDTPSIANVNWQIGTKFKNENISNK